MTETRSPAELLRAARQRITLPERWTQGAYARDQDGRDVHPTADSACKWCLVGALAAELEISATYAEHTEAFLLLRSSEFTHPIFLNDRRDHADALNLLDKAIELAEASA